MLKIRLRRTGAKKQPAYRVVVAESTAPRDGTFLENLGHYNPLSSPTTFEVKEERVKEWLQRGAQPSDRVARLLTSRGIITPPAEAATPAPPPPSKPATSRARTTAAAEPAPPTKTTAEAESPAPAEAPAEAEPATS